MHPPGTNTPGVVSADMSSTFATVGGGLAGARAVEALRDKDFKAGMNVNIWERLDDIKTLIRSRATLGDA